MNGLTRMGNGRRKFSWRAICAAAWLAAACAAHAAPAPAAQGRANRAQAVRALEEGVAAFERGDAAAAKAAFERALAAGGDKALARTYLGALADRAGDLKAAERHFAAAVEAAPLLASARNNYGVILMRTNRPRLAAAQFEASLKIDPRQTSALVNLAQIRFASGSAEDLRAARELFERAHAVSPDAETARALVVVALRLGERERAAAAYRDYAARVSGAQGAAARAELGAALAAGGLLEEAAAELAAASALDPSNVNAVVALARAHLKRKDIPAAGRALEAAAARGLDDARLYAALADVYEAGGYVENAIPAMRLAIARDPKNELYHARYGMLLIDTKAPAAAIIRLREALGEFPRSARLWLALGIAQLQVETLEDPLEALNNALRLEPQSVPALVYLGAAHADRGRYEEAISFYERAIAADAKVAILYYLVADVMLKQPAHDAARVEKYLLRAIELDPELASAHVALGKLYLNSQRWADAARHLERAAAIQPDLAEAHYHLGRVYTRLRRREEAQTALATFERLKAAQDRRVVHKDLIRRLADVRF